MKQYILAVLLLASATVSAQDVDLDKKTGLVQVNGADAFYLTPKNKQLMESDYALENLQHEELAYLNRTKGVKYNRDGSSSNTINFHMVFTKTGNQCVMANFGMLNTMKSVAKEIASANLVQDGRISETEERKFILLNHGTFVKETKAASPTEKVVVNNNNNAPSAPADISLKETNIYNHSELVGVFKRTAEGDNTVISVYNANDALVCKATHLNGDDNADWNIQADGRAITLLYNNAAPLEKLFKYLVEKGLL